jgi:hypothetical protein
MEEFAHVGFFASALYLPIELLLLPPFFLSHFVLAAHRVTSPPSPPHPPPPTTTAPTAIRLLAVQGAACKALRWRPPPLRPRAWRWRSGSGTRFCRWRR